MSPLRIAALSQLLLAVDVSALATVQKPAEQASVDVAALEAAVQAKYSRQEPMPEADASGKVEATSEVPSDIAQLEAAVQAKYKLDESRPEVRANDKVKAKEDVPAEIAQLEAAVQAKFKLKPESASDKVEAKAEASSEAAQPGAEAKAEVPAEIAQLEAAVQAKFKLKPESKASDNVEAKTQASSDAALSAQVNTVADSKNSASQSLAPAQLQKESNTAEEASAKGGLKVADAANIERPIESSSAKPESYFKLKAEKQAESPSDSKKQGGEVQKSQTIVINDRYRKHGAAMVHVEPTPRRKDSNEANKRSAREAAAKERAAKLAEKRAEVEDYFHLSKASAPKMNVQPTTQEQQPRGAGSTLLFCIFSLAAICSLAGVAYHKYEVILQICKGQQVSPKFKAKQEDIHFVEGGGFAAPPYAQHNCEYQSWSATRSVLRSSAPGSHHGLARRGASCPMDSYDSGV